MSCMILQIDTYATVLGILVWYDPWLHNQDYQQYGEVLAAQLIALNVMSFNATYRHRPDIQILGQDMVAAAKEVIAAKSDHIRITQLPLVQLIKTLDCYIYNSDSAPNGVADGVLDRIRAVRADLISDFIRLSPAYRDAVWG